MAKENITNFATTSLVTPSPLTSGGTSFTVTAGQGALFPTANFLVTIDSEILLITSRSTDTFTIGTRGYDGTVAASHTSGVTVQLSISAQHVNHLWQNVPDTYNPVVPPANQLAGLTANAADNEFEALGSWTLFPTSPSSGSLWNVNTSLRSHLLCDRSYGDSTIYAAYGAFSPASSTPFMVTLKTTHGVSFISGPNSGNQMTLWFAVTDQTNPVSGTLSGNRFQIKMVVENTTLSTSNPNIINSAVNQYYNVQISAHAASSGTSVPLNPVLTFSQAMPLWLRLYFDGTSTWTAYVGDGLTYWAIANRTSTSFTPQTIALQFEAAAGIIGGTQAIDYVRVQTGSVNPRFGG